MTHKQRISDPQTSMAWPRELNEVGLSNNIQDNEDFKCKYITRSDPLGDGNFSVVKECMNIHTKELYAMKLIHKDVIKGKLQLIQREFHLLKYLSQQIRFLEQTGSSNDVVDTFQGHHHILQLFDYFETTANIVLITQLCHKDDLYEKIISNEHLNLIKQVKPYTACLISVLDFLHSQGVVHRDIKAENILFRLNKNTATSTSTTTENNEYDLTAHDLILGDFGLALEMNNDTGMALKEYVGTMSYISPEIVKCKGIGLMTSQEINSISQYDSKVDIWALGVLVYFMAMGYTPFDCETDEETLECILNCDYYIDESLVNDPIYKDFWNFIQCCFVKDNLRRRSARTLKSHPFIQEFFISPSLQEDINLVTSPSVAHLPKLKKNKSLTSLHNLKKPPIRRQSSSLITRIESKKQSFNIPDLITPPPSMAKSSTNLMKQQNHLLQSQMWHPPSSANLYIQSSNANVLSSNSSMSSMHTNNNNNNNNNTIGHHPNGLTPLTPFTPATNNTTRDGPPNLAKIRDTLRRTISMTSIKTQDTSATSSTNLTNGFPSSDQLTRNNQTNSTFFLDPQPPKGSLMNGVFCETPESLSNFNTTPRSSLSLSRQNSQSNEIPTVNSIHSNNNNHSNINNHNNINSNSYVLSRSSSYTNVKKPYFELNFEDDE